MSNYEYLYSILNLYLKKENDSKKTNLNITKKSDKVTFSFSMKENNLDKTTYDLPITIVNSYLSTVLMTLKENLLIIDEKYDFDNYDKTCYYYVKFKNGRVLSFNGFSVLEINNIRNILYDIKTYKEEIRVDLSDTNEIKMNYQPYLPQAGFVSFKYISLMVLFFSDIFMLSLWICKLLMK